MWDVIGLCWKRRGMVGWGTSIYCSKPGAYLILWTGFGWMGNNSEDPGYTRFEFHLID